MATSKRTLTKRTDAKGEAEILLRVTLNHQKQFRVKSGVRIAPDRMGPDGSIIFPRRKPEEAERIRQKEKQLRAVEERIADICAQEAPDSITTERLNEEVQRLLHPESFAQRDECPGIADTLAVYIDKCGLAEQSRKNLRVVLRHIIAFELWKKAIRPRANFRLTFDNFDTKQINAFVDFLRAEPDLYKKHTGIFDKAFASAYKENKDKTRKSRTPETKGTNAIANILKRLRTFSNWAVKMGYIEVSPFRGADLHLAETYGTPYYLTPEERDLIADFDLSAHPAMAVQRDVFIFQCLIGCRVSDLLRLTEANVVEGAVEYIPDKTKGSRVEVVRVPLHPRAARIIDRYKGNPKGKLLPFTSSQKYNDSIKKVLTLCGVTRKVTILNPTTGEEEQRPINEIASSHMARRTFVGNLYKQVKDPNLVGALSGHKEGSKAFARYRAIDEDIKKSLIELL